MWSLKNKRILSPEELMEAAQQKAENDHRATITSSRDAGRIARQTVSNLENIAGGASHASKIIQQHDDMYALHNDYLDAVNTGNVSSIEASREALNKAVGDVKNSSASANKHIEEVNKVSGRMGSALESTNKDYQKVQKLENKAAAAEAKAAASAASRVTRSSMAEGISEIGSKAWSFTKKGAKIGGIGALAVAAVGVTAALLSGNRANREKESQDSIQRQETDAMRAQNAAMIGAPTMMGLEPAPGMHAARVAAARGGQEMAQGAINPDVSLPYDVVR